MDYVSTLSPIGYVFRMNTFASCDWNSEVDRTIRQHLLGLHCLKFYYLGIFLGNCYDLLGLKEGDNKFTEKLPKYNFRRCQLEKCCLIK